MSKTFKQQPPDPPRFMYRMHYRNGRTSDGLVPTMNRHGVPLDDHAKALWDPMDTHDHRTLAEVEYIEVCELVPGRTVEFDWAGPGQDWRERGKQEDAG